MSQYGKFNTAVSEGDYDTVEEMINLLICLRYPVTVTCKKGDMKMFNLLKEHAAHHNQPLPADSILITAASYNTPAHTEMCRQVLPMQHHTVISNIVIGKLILPYINTNYYNWALRQACHAGNEEVVKMLVDLGAVDSQAIWECKTGCYGDEAKIERIGKMLTSAAVTV